MDKIMAGITELKYTGDFDKIDLMMLDKVMDDLNEMKRSDLLAQHPYKIWRGNNGNWYTYIPDEQDNRTLRYRKTREAIENLVIKYIKEKIESPTVSELFEEWLQKRVEREEIEKSTATRYQKVFHQCFGKIKDRKVRTLKEIEIEDFLKDTIKEQQLSRKAYSNMRTLVYGLFRYAKKKKLIAYRIKEVVADIDFSKKEFTETHHTDEEQVFMQDEEKKIIDYLMEHQDMMNLAILLLFKSGLRIGELCALMPADITDTSISVNKTEVYYLDKDGKICYDIKDSTKTPAGIRTVILPDRYKWIVDKIRRLNPFGEYLFMKNGKRIRQYQIRDRLRYICRLLEIVPKSPHKIRKTYGTKLYDAGSVPKSLMIEQMGHADVSVLEKHYYYNRMNDAQKKETINNVSNF